MELYGKVIDFLGDSITEGVGVKNIETGRYDNIIKIKYGLKAAYNYGIGGTRIAHQCRPSVKPRHDLCFCGRAYNLNPDAEIIVVYGGTNDYIHGDAPFGNLDDETPATFCGGVEFLMTILTQMYPKAQLVFMTPAHCMVDNHDDTIPSIRANKLCDAKPMSQYVEVIQKKARLHNIPVLNLYKKLKINPNNPSDKDKYTADGLHFNDEGHKILADLLADFIINEI